MDSSSGMGFWATLSEQELLIIINRPEAYSAVQRAFAAQELSNKLSEKTNGKHFNIYHQDHSTD